MWKNFTKTWDILAINNSGKGNYGANVFVWLLSFMSHFTFLPHAPQNSNYQTTSVRLLITTLSVSKYSIKTRRCNVEKKVHKVSERSEF